MVNVATGGDSSTGEMVSITLLPVVACTLWQEACVTTFPVKNLRQSQNFTYI